MGVPLAVADIDIDLPRFERSGHPQTANLQGFLDAVVVLLSESGYYWSHYEADGSNWQVPESTVDTAIGKWPHWASRYDSALSALGGGTVDARWVMREIINRVGGFNVVNVVTIRGDRRIADIGSESAWSTGRGLVKALAELQNPGYADWNEKRAQWESINRFVQTVLGDQDARLNIPHDASTIQVETPSRTLPLASLGSGVEQVIILASAATVTSGSVVCVEEPETNLHPILQKKFIDYLNVETSNQYIIATHSSHLLDEARATIHHLELTDTGTSSTLARRRHELVRICNDLGYRPSDIMQANCVIWVEGPSDRTYIRRWLELVDADLAEGIHYSIMFYGGKLLSHLSASDAALSEFIALRKLSHASVVVIDSDRKSSRARLGKTKARIKTEFEADVPAPGFAWVTSCYTIENYLPSDKFKHVVDQLYPNGDWKPVNRWDNPLPMRNKGKYDKVGISNTLSPKLDSCDLDIFDLRSKIVKLVEFIHAANGGTATSARGAHA